MTFFQSCILVYAIAISLLAVFVTSLISAISATKNVKGALPFLDFISVLGGAFFMCAALELLDKKSCFKELSLRYKRYVPYQLLTALLLLA